MCGGTAVSAGVARAPDGLSPRVRGNRPPRGSHRRSGRSIPACAGEPYTTPCCLRRPRVYPRVCGGTHLRKNAEHAVGGLSPCVRGNHHSCIPTRDTQRSIPVCAGEPCCPRLSRTGPTVYPRVCGGTPLPIGLLHHIQGLSPCVRGNPFRVAHRPQRLGSIPACAGEPCRSRDEKGGIEVYPRVCGGTHRFYRGGSKRGGLSPRVRGNHVQLTVLDRRCRSIPACAGEPPPSPPIVGASRVYPRVCGGTPVRLDFLVRLDGLSPRVRGNRPPRGSHRRSGRSIPACAGEPNCLAYSVSLSEVYPRVCGGTGIDRVHAARRTGLSPRVRGNPCPP